MANNAAKLLASNTVISHRDLDSKNVMWNQDNPVLIDWESAGYINPMQDLIETAIYWSENEIGSIDKKRNAQIMKNSRWGLIK
ncbi:phosphotransferase [Chengkuizengella sp. SCS-71B]|uniref:phosphotransferase n=1 Tax=Chengkuizengella sp. SCS-71B TaxID=3115290 RepID=UPI0032C244E3